MPCIDEFADREYEREQQKKAAFTRAALCGVLTMLEHTYGEDFESILRADFDAEETGVRVQELLNWWNEHKEKDVARQQREAAEAKKEEARKAALKKLTKKERKILGVE